MIAPKKPINPILVARPIMINIMAISMIKPNPMNPAVDDWQVETVKKGGEADVIVMNV